MKLAISITLLLACVFQAAAQAPAATPDFSNIPSACLSSGALLQTECGSTFTEAQTFFNIAPGSMPAPGSISPQQIQAYLAQAKPPSPGCCKVACEFNNAFCSCEQSVLHFAATLAGSSEVFQTIGHCLRHSLQVQAVCGYDLPCSTAEGSSSQGCMRSMSFLIQGADVCCFIG